MKLLCNKIFFSLILVIIILSTTLRVEKSCDGATPTPSEGWECGEPSNRLSELHKRPAASSRGWSYRHFPIDGSKTWAKLPQGSEHLATPNRLGFNVA